MVGVAAGSMNIRGSLDTSLIERGFDRVGAGFESVKGFAKGFTSDLTRMTTGASRLAKRMGALALVGVGTMVALAKSAPAVAPALAKMKVSMMKLSFALGEALAPAFERVAGWLEKFATWVGNNKEKIGEIANKFLDFGQTIAEFVWPILKKIGDWALDHPKLFAGIVAGLILGPKVIAGITALGGLVATLAGATVAAPLLTALGYIALIGAAGYAGYKGAKIIVDKLRTYAGMGTDPDAPTDMSGQTLVSRLPQKIRADITGRPAPWENTLNPFSPAYQREIDRIKAEGYRPTSGGMISALREEDRRFFLLSWWDALWS